MLTEQQVKRSRRLKYRLVQLVLGALTLGLAVAFLSDRREQRTDREMSLTTDVPTTSDLGPGDARLFNVDTTVELILRADKMLVGLSARKIEEIRAQINKPDTKGDASGLGAAIAKTVKEQVADKIAIHAEYDVRDIDRMWIEDHQIVVQWRNGKKETMFGSVKVDKDRATFHVEEAQRFIELVNARKKQLSR